MRIHRSRRRACLGIRPRLASIGAGLALAAATAAAQTAGPLSLDDALQTAIARSRLIVATQAQTQAARETAVAAGQRPDPVLKLGINNLPTDGPDRGSLTRDFMTMRSVALMQEFTRTDKLDARIGRALREVQAGAVAERQVLADLRRDTALAWFDRSFQQSMRDLLQAQVTESEQQVQAAEVAYRGGKGSRADVLATRVEVERLHDRLDENDHQIDAATMQLTRWIGEAAAQPAAPRPALVLAAWADGDWAGRVAELPQMAVIQQQAALAQADVNVARANGQPDWSVELMFSQRGPSYSNMVSLNVSVPLPWAKSQRQDRDVAARQAMVARAEAERDDLQRAAEADLRKLLHEWRTQGQRLARFDGSLLPLARERIEAALTAYRGGGGSLSAVLDARRAELETRIDRLRIEMDIARLWAQLAFLIPDGNAP